MTVLEAAWNCGPSGRDMQKCLGNFPSIVAILAISKESAEPSIGAASEKICDDVRGLVQQKTGIGP